MVASVYIESDQSELADLIRLMEQEFPQDLKTELAEAHSRIEKEVVVMSKEMSPISPTKAQYEATLVGGKTRRTNFHPGQLMGSIQGESNERHAKIFVPSNSPGGKYADFIHYNMDYQYGVGTRAKGPLAGRLFISRAVDYLKRTGRLLTIVRERLDIVLQKHQVIE